MKNAAAAGSGGMWFAGGVEEGEGEVSRWLIITVVLIIRHGVTAKEPPPA